jgi:putative membrane protein
VSTEAERTEKKLNKVAWVLSAAVLALVVLMRAVRIPVPVDFGFLPPLHATLNALTAVALVVALVFAKQRRVAQHRAAIFVAIGLSIVFLLSYVVYHFTTPEVRFGDVNHDGLVDAAEKATVGGTRFVYLALLATHVVLAALILPFILLTFNRAYTGQFARHKQMARWVWPIWFYVAVSGPICWWMLRPYYPLPASLVVGPVSRAEPELAQLLLQALSHHADCFGRARNVSAVLAQRLAEEAPLERLDRRALGLGERRSGRRRK